MIVDLNQTGSLLIKPDFWGKAIKKIFIVVIAVLPWFILPNIAKPLELPREILLFLVAGATLIMWFFRSLSRREFEWRRTKLGWIIGIWLVALLLLFLYAKNFLVAWAGYAGSFTGGLSEYLAFFVFYFLAVQLFSPEEWQKNIETFLKSLLLSLIFFIGATIYFKSNAILTINFAKTPTLITAAAGVVALASWWILKRSESLRKSKIFILMLIFFFVTSLLDFYISFFMWMGGTLLVLFFDFVTRLESYRQEKEVMQLGIGKQENKLMKIFFHGDAKYLFLVLLFALSRAVSPIFMGQQKLTVFPFESFLTNYPLFGQKTFFYLLINFIVFCWGVYYFFRAKKERPAIVLVLSGLLSISLGYIFYYTESVLYYFLNWMLLALAGVSFLRSLPEKDYFCLIKPKSKGEGVVFAVSVGVAVVVAGLIFLRLKGVVF